MSTDDALDERSRNDDQRRAATTDDGSYAIRLLGSLEVEGPDGRKLIFDAGRIFWAFDVDTKGDNDLSNDEFVADYPPSVAGPHPILDGVAGFCDLVGLLR